MSETTLVEHSCPSCGAVVKISTTVTTTVVAQPKYASIGGVTMRWVKEGYYWRDNGRWGCDAVWKDSKLVAVSNHRALSHINEIEIIEISRTEWALENGNNV